MNQSSKKLQSPPSRKDVNAVYNWCLNKYGLSQYQDSFPLLEYRRPDLMTHGLAGEYDEINNLIFINRDENPTLEDVILTMIHEWVHYLQPIEEHLNQITESYLQPDDPLEVEAEMISHRDMQECFEEVFLKSKQKKK